MTKEELESYVGICRGCRYLRLNDVSINTLLDILKNLRCSKGNCSSIIHRESCLFCGQRKDIKCNSIFEKILQKILKVLKNFLY